MPTELWAPITPPVHAPPVIGLIPTARALGTYMESSATGDNHWLNGYTFEPETCDDDGTGNFAHCDPPDTIEPSDPTGFVNTNPYVIYATDRCSTFGFNSRDYQGRARRRLMTCESRLVAKELEAGTLAIDQGWDNQYFQEATTRLSDINGEDPEDALACLEEYLADCMCGSPGWIHAPRSVVSRWTYHGAVGRAADGVLYTQLGTVVVPDGGYRGLAPTGLGNPGNVKWAYATPPIHVRLGPVQVVPDSLTQATNHLANDIEYRSQRFASTFFDGCCLAGIGVQIEVCSSIGS